MKPILPQLWRLPALLLCALAFFNACQSPEPTTAKEAYQQKYGAPTVSSLDAYLEQVKKQPDHALVDLKDYLSSAQFDLVYAREDNFMGEAVYTKPAAYLRKPAALAMQQVEKALDSLGIGLKIWDAYRPYRVTVLFYEHVLDSTFAASPYTGSKHNRGCAIDLTLFDKKTGQELAMPTPFDEFTERAHIAYQDLPEEVLRNRQLLIETMRKYGFEVYADEWWHFDFKDWQNFVLMDLEFEELDAAMPL